jgi:hypothetical protein
MTDCAEKEATYIITTGGINDPDKAWAPSPFRGHFLPAAGILL